MNTEQYKQLEAALAKHTEGGLQLDPDHYRVEGGLVPDGDVDCLLVWTQPQPDKENGPHPDDCGDLAFRGDVRFHPARCEIIDDYSWDTKEEAHAKMKVVQAQIDDLQQRMVKLRGAAGIK